VNHELTVERLFQALCAGDRTSARAIIRQCTDEEGVSAEELAHNVFWPSLELLNQLFRADQLSTLAHHYAMRLLRSLADQCQAMFTQEPRRGRKILMFSGECEADELAGQMTADLLEANGYEVFFGGGGIANDEVLAEVGNHHPDVLLMFSSGPTDAPNIRVLIDTVRSVDSTPDMQIAVGGGVFNRAAGLAEEIGADLWAKTPAELIDNLEQFADRRATEDQRTVGRNRVASKSAAA